MAETAGIASQDPLVQQFGPKLKTLIDDNVNGDVDREKVYQYSKARKNELYWRGKQYVYPVLIGSDVADWSSSGTIAYNANPDERKNQYDYTINIIRGDGRKFVAVLGQRSPNATAIPDRSDDEGSAGRARKANNAASYLRSQWNVEQIQRHLAMSLWKNGTTFIYTPWRTDSGKYGTYAAQHVEMTEQKSGPDTYRCPQCGAQVPDSMVNPAQPSCPMCNTQLGPEHFQAAPMEQVPQFSQQEYSKGTVECHLATIFEVTTPFYGKTLRDLPWLWYEYEETKGSLIAAWPQLRSKLQQDVYSEGTGVSAQGRLARDVASSPTGSYISPRKNRWLYTRIWLKPNMYELLEDENIRNGLYQNFPKGVKVTLVQNEIVALEHEDLCDVWAMCKPETSEYIFADPICDDYMGIQDLTNDMYNITIETLERAIPFLIADPTVLDMQQFRKHAGLPAEVIPAKAGIGGRLDQSIVKAPTADLDPNIMKWPGMIQGVGREIVGIIPAIFGGEGPSPTARQAELQRNQALQQLNTVWNEMRDCWAQVYTNGVRLLAKYAMPDGSNLGGFSDDVADYEDLAQGGYHFSCEEAMPMTWGQQRDLIMFLLQQSPQAQQAFGLTNPLNIPDLQEVLGLPSWRVQNLEARNKVMRTIQQLLKGQPVPQPPMAPGGVAGPASDLPSIPIDQFEDDHMFSAQVVKEWAQLEKTAEIRAQNPLGYRNVIAWGMAHLNALGNPPNPAGASPSQGAGGPAPGGSPGPMPGDGSGLVGPPGAGPGLAGPPPPAGALSPTPQPGMPG